MRHIGIRPDCTLDLDDFRRQLSPRTRLVAVGCGVERRRHGQSGGRDRGGWRMPSGRRCFVDAVHYAPHRLIDVAAWQCDFLACSAYKFFGPHVGVMWGRRELLESLTAYKVRPAPNELPGKWMTGTQNHEASPARWRRSITWPTSGGRRGDASSRRERLRRGVRTRSRALRTTAGRAIADRASIGCRSSRACGITDAAQFDERVPTFSISHRTLPSIEVARRLAAAGIYAWHGNFYALPLTETLGVEPAGLVRIGLLHYNTSEEVDYLLDVLKTID